MIESIIPIVIALFVNPTISPSPTVIFYENVYGFEKQKEKLSAFNISAEKQIKSVAKKAVGHSPVLIPCDHPDAKCQRETRIFSTPIPTLQPPIIAPTQIPEPTSAPTIIPEPTEWYPIDPPPCDWERYTPEHPSRPGLEEEKIIMPCLHLDQ